MLIYSDPKYVYYIVTPPYTQKSAGIRCLHLLCHALNLRGQIAYILRDPMSIESNYPQTSGPDLLTPHLSRSIAETHLSRGQKPIIVYPESISGNPYNASCVVRYVLNFPGLLGGDLEYSSEEICFGYTSVLAKAARYSDNVLFIPMVDTRVFKIAAVQPKRRGTCFYAAKYRSLGGDPSLLVKDSIEITRDDPASQTPEEIAQLFQSSELFVAYDNTALAIEAVLCGCPTVFVPNPFLHKIIAADELGAEGYAWGTAADEVSRAKESVGQGAKNYLATVRAFWPHLDTFIDSTHAHARQNQSTETFCFLDGASHVLTRPIEQGRYKTILGLRLPFRR